MLHVHGGGENDNGADDATLHGAGQVLETSSIELVKACVEISKCALSLSLSLSLFEEVLKALSLSLSLSLSLRADGSEI